MNKKKVLRSNYLILAGIAIIWIIVFVLYQNNPFIGPDYWKGFVLGLIGVGVAEICIILQARSNKSTEEIGYIPDVYTAAYIVIILSLNAFYAYMKKHVISPILLAVDLAVMLIYCLLMYHANQSLNRVNELTEYSADKMINISNITKQLDVLLGLSADSDITHALRQLKEKVALSSNISQNFSREAEIAVFQKLTKIQNEVQNEADKRSILNQIKEVEILWNTRNSRINTTK